MKNIFYHSAIARGILYFSKCHSIMLFGLVFSKQKEHEMTQATRNHECVHARQWSEVAMVSGLIVISLVLALDVSPWWLFLSGLTYYAWYAVEWLCKSIWCSVMADEWTCDMETPYQSIGFEREARKAYDDPNYLENSGYFGWLGLL